MPIMSPHVRESKFQNPGNCCLWNLESGKFLLLESGIQLEESGIPLVCYTAVFSVVTQRSRGGALRHDTKNGCMTGLGYKKNSDQEVF